jgi:Acyl-CoA synthetase (NDP forming)
MDARRIADLAQAVRADGRTSFTELEGYELLEAMGLETPRRLLVRGSEEAEGILRRASSGFFPGDRAVVKVVSPDILHKTEAGGVAIVPNALGDIVSAIRVMEDRFSRPSVAGLPAVPRVQGYTVNEFLRYDRSLGHEIIVGYRFARDFGPLVSFGPGGIYAEYLAASFREGAASLFLSPASADRASVEKLLKNNIVRNLLAGRLRGTEPEIDEGALVDIVMAFVEAADLLAAAGISEFEVNPFVVVSGPERGAARLVALDALAKLDDIGRGELELDEAGRFVNSGQAARPVAKIDNLLRPASAAIAGVSEKSVNNGRIILRNLIASGFDRGRLYVVKPGSGNAIEGCPCYPDFASLPERVDLAVLAIPAAAAAEAIAGIAETGMAESIIVTSGGLEEKAGTELLVSRMRTALSDSRKTDGGGPVVNGGNCLGVRSLPGRYNTLFIPEYKLPMPSGAAQPIAFISQSGAFAVSRVSKHPNVNPKYLVTCGNQLDLTVGDYLDRLADDGEIRLFALYVEGFKSLDGAKALAATKRIVDSGRDLIIYRAGRSAEGAKASASHTASIAGDFAVTKALFSQAGAVIAESLEDFDDYLTAFALLQGKKAMGTRLGAVSNAGFECVAMADNLGRLELARFSQGSLSRLGDVIAKAGIGEIVDLHNPLDLTPSSPDSAYDESFRVMLEDEGVDCGIVGIVPLTAAMNTLAAGPSSNGEDILREGSLALRYGELMASSKKPWVAVVDSGALYDALSSELERRGVPVFRTADRALWTLNAWVAARRGRP